VKFIQNANSAGANFEDLLIAAVSKEVANISKRRSDGIWKNPRYYALLTNAPVSISLRDRVCKILQKALRKTEILLYGGGDICDMLDQHESLRRSFPQLLGLRDLDELIHKAVSKEAIERSRTAIESARDVVQVFVPTGAYAKTWKILHEHNFAVLEGPPEMGKTAIAWMIGLALLSQGWQAIACDKPEDFFQLYEPGVRQIFIADDAFGRTEYDPTRGKLWERYLDRVINQLDANHWLIWTSRKHILERARQTMDLQGQVRRFPSPAAVLVDASVLSIREKALILYRHARAIKLEQDTRELVRNNAANIVRDPSFTPERIRRFVREVVPDLILEKAKGRLSDHRIKAEIRRAIRTPTDRMQKTFKALDISHKALLLALLEAGHTPSYTSVKKLYEAHSELLDNPAIFEEVLEEMSESFIKSG
jgi:hypothetical protein